MNDRINYRCGFVTLIGKPNTGKSTLMNRMIGQKIAITSARPQTTRKQIRTILTDDEAQMIFIDTPGVHVAKNHLGNYMDNAAKSALKDVDGVIFMADADNARGGVVDEIEQEILDAILKCGAPFIVVLNKVDEYSLGALEEAKNIYAKKAPSAKICTTCALKGDGVDELIAEIKKLLPYGEAMYDEDELTDQPIRDIAAEIIREKALRLLNEEVPHGIAVSIEKMHERKTGAGDLITDIEASIICERDTHKGIIIGRGGKMIRNIGSLAREDIEKLLEMKVNLQLFVKVRKDWRNDETQLRSLGYTK